MAQIASQFTFVPLWKGCQCYIVRLFLSLSLSLSLSRFLCAFDPSILYFKKRYNWNLNFSSIKVARDWEREREREKWVKRLNVTENVQEWGYKNGLRYNSFHNSNAAYKRIRMHTLHSKGRREREWERERERDAHPTVQSSESLLWSAGQLSIHILSLHSKQMKALEYFNQLREYQFSLLKVRLFSPINHQLSNWMAVLVYLLLWWLLNVKFKLKPLSSDTNELPHTHTYTHKLLFTCVSLSPSLWTFVLLSA